MTTSKQCYLYQLHCRWTCWSGISMVTGTTPTLGYQLLPLPAALARWCLRERTWRISTPLTLLLRSVGVPRLPFGYAVCAAPCIKCLLSVPPFFLAVCPAPLSLGTFLITATWSPYAQHIIITEICALPVLLSAICVAPCYEGLRPRQ